MEIRRRSEPMTYRKAGVDIEEEGDSIRALVDRLSFKRTGLGELAGPKGHFTGLLDFGEWYLSLCTDGVGTKIRIAEEMQKYDTIGIDCMAMNVNDMICIGAEPLAFVDYIAAERPTPDIMSEIGKGLNAGAEMANVSIVGGETATLPEMVMGLDLAGTCLGAVRKEDVVDTTRMRPGDLIVGLPSTGVHSNGYTLVRRVLEAADISFASPLAEIVSSKGWSEIEHDPDDRPVVEDWVRGQGSTVIGQVLLEPTAIYVRGVMEMFSRVPRERIKGLANITGGGLRNICRLRGDMLFRIDDPLPVPPIFRLLRALGKVEAREMYQTFNMGLGFVIVVSPEAVSEVIDALSIYSAKVIGKVEEGKGVVDTMAGVRYDGYV